MRIALDGSGLLVGEDAVIIDTARHADVLLDDGGSPQSGETVSLWQRNLACLRAERFIRLAVRADAVAWASV